MCALESASGRHELARDLAPPMGAFAHPLAQRATGGQLHRDEHRVPVDAHLVHGQDVRVGELCHRAGLSKQALAGLGGRGAREPVGAQYLDGEGSIQVGIVGAVDGAHTALAEGLAELESADSPVTTRPRRPRASSRRSRDRRARAHARRFVQLERLVAIVVRHGSSEPARAIGQGTIGQSYRRRRAVRPRRAACDLSIGRQCRRGMIRGCRTVARPHPPDAPP